MGEKKGFFKRLVSGLAKTRDNIVSGIDSIFNGFSSIDEDFYEELEEILIMGDLGIHATMKIIEDLKAKVKENHIKEPAECKQLLIDSIKEQMSIGDTAYEFENRTSVVPVSYTHLIQAQGDGEIKYRRSSLYSMMINHEGREFGDEIKDVFLLSLIHISSSMP